MNKRQADKMSKFKDADQEFKETKSEDARKRRHEAMFSEDHAHAKRCAEQLAGRSADEGQASRDRLKRAGSTEWKKRS